MAEIECGKGHLYDSDKYAACPYCNIALKPEQKAAGAAGRTVPLQPQNVRKNNNVTRPVMPIDSAVGKTRPLNVSRDSRSASEPNRTVGLMREKLGIDPVVGWLVCVNGKLKGRDFKLYGHINTIGRSSKMDICLEDDRTISEENHARISYSDKNNRFNIIPADGKNLFYVNGNEILMPTRLAAYDVIDFGETALIFVPLCCDRFIWNTPSTK